MMTNNLFGLSLTGSASSDVLLIYIAFMLTFLVFSRVTGEIIVRRFERRAKERLEDLQRRQGTDEED